MMNTTLLQYVSKEVTSGRPLWGMLQANENLNTNSPIRRALARKAQSRITFTSRENATLLDEILKGKTLQELPPSTASTLRELEGVLRRRNFKVPGRVSWDSRRALRANHQMRPTMRVRTHRFAIGSSSLKVSSN